MGILPAPYSRDVGHLVVKRKPGESITITTADGTVVTVTRIGISRIRVSAPKSAKILRSGLADREGSR
jgi:sRNA-binding carbon storage regulator CsrA